MGEPIEVVIKLEDHYADKLRKVAEIYDMEPEKVVNIIVRAYVVQEVADYVSGARKKKKLHKTEENRG